MQRLQLKLSVVLVLGLLSSITPLAIDTYLSSIPTIAKEIQTEVNFVQLTVSVYLLTFACFQLLFGPISDALGRRRVIFFGLSLYAIGSMVCAFSSSFELLISGRVIQAFGGAAVAVCVPALVSDSFTKEQFSKAMSYVFLVMAIAPLIAPPLGGVILVLLSWHYIFLFLALIACIAMLLFARHIPETLPTEKRIPLSLPIALENYLMLLGNRGVMGHILAGACHFGGLMCLVTGSAFVYIEFYGIDEVYFGFLFGVCVIGMMIMSTINSQLVERLGSKTMIQISLGIVISASILLVVMSFLEKPPLLMLLMTTTLFIAPVSTLGSNLMVGALSYAETTRGSVVALTGTSRFMMGALSGATVSLLHDETFVPMVSIMALMGFLSLSAYFFLAPEKPTTL